MPSPRSLYAGSRVRAARNRAGLSQAEAAKALGISASYLSQIENDERPVTTPVLAALSRRFALDLEQLVDSQPASSLAAIAELADDPLLGESGFDHARLSRLVESQPDLGALLLHLHRAYRQAQERALMIDDTLAGLPDDRARPPWEEARDWFHEAGNYIDLIDREAERIARELGDDLTPDGLARRLTKLHGVAVETRRDDGDARALSRFDRASRRFFVDGSTAAETRYFQLAQRLALQEIRDAIAAIATSANLRSEPARQLVRIGLANYAAGALIMPYERFRDQAMAQRHDIDRLSNRFGVSFEQACHRISTLQRPGARGIPFFFCRVDMAGNITKRHSATRLQFARFGGACPLWVVHEAVAIPDRILVQVAETPDGARYVSMAKGLVKPSGSYRRRPRRYAVALGCEAEHARHFIYADGLDTVSPDAITPIGISCRICPREDCDQRAFPPTDRPLVIDPDRRGVVPYRMG